MTLYVPIQCLYNSHSIQCSKVLDRFVKCRGKARLISNINSQVFHLDAEVTFQVDEVIDGLRSSVHDGYIATILGDSSRSSVSNASAPTRDDIVLPLESKTVLDADKIAVCKSGCET